MEGQDPGFFDEDGVLRPPLPPEDRLWRHPSELPGLTAHVPAHAHRSRPIWTAALVLGLSGAALMVAVQIKHSPTSPGSGAMADVARTLLSVPSSLAPGTSDAPGDTAAAVVMAQQVRPSAPNVFVGTTWRPAIVLDSGQLVVADPEGIEGHDLVVNGTDGNLLDVRAVTLSREVGIALVTVDAKLPASGYRAGPPPPIGEQVVVNARTGVVVALRTEPAADGRLFEPASVIKIDEVAIGDLAWQGSRFVGLVVAVHGHYATVMPSQLVLSAAASLANHRELAWVGMAVQQSGDGVVVAAVDAGGPADRAGLQPGDVLTSIDGHQLTRADDVLEYLWQCGAHRDAIVLSERKGRSISVTVTLASVPIDA